MKRTIRILLTLLVGLSLTTPVMAADQPGKGVTVRPGRATWSTDYFTGAIAMAGLRELGYKVKKPKELSNPLFYQSLALGDLDYWVSGYFPMHYTQMPKIGRDNVVPIGYIVKAGNLQGYLVSKKYAEKYNIKSLDDFKRPEVKKAFDANGDGKADLTACPPGWGCEKIISYHLKTYGLEKDINPIKATYSASMAEALARYQHDEPIFFYTWTPNWTIFKLQPGKDVVWINVPKIKPLPEQKGDVDRMVVHGVKGAVTDPIKLGFVVGDIRVVANKNFLAKNPAAATFLKHLSVPLKDINAQNLKMQEGEKSQRDIDRHAAQWIKAHRATFDKWLDAARKAAE